jgi:hypothetical protein
VGWNSLNAFWEWLATAWQSVVPPAAIDFPDEPSADQEFGRFYWNDEKQTWDFS